MFVFGYDIPLVEIILTLGVITIIILLEAIVILALLIYYKKTGRKAKPTAILKEKISKLISKLKK